MAAITDHYLRQQLKKITNNPTPHLTPNTMGDTTTGGGTSTGTGGTTTTQSGNAQVTLEEKKFKIISNYGNKIITTDNKVAEILQPLPCVRWGSPVNPDNQGKVFLRNEIGCTVLTVGDRSVVLGFTGASCGVCTDLELLVDLGETEVYMTDEVLSIKAKNHAKDGVQQQ